MADWSDLRTTDSLFWALHPRPRDINPCPDITHSGGTIMKRQHILTPIWLILILLIFTTCSEEPDQPFTETEVNEIKRALEKRMFRQFVPYDKNAPRRKSVAMFLDDGITMWVQYSEYGYGMILWTITSTDYRIEQTQDDSELRLYFIEPHTERQYPDPCNDCIDTTGVSISVRNVFEKNTIEFKINDPDKSLPPPMPIFTSWTRYEEDQPNY